MKNPAAPTFDPSLLAVLHRNGKAWHALVVNRAEARPVIVSSREFTLDQASRIDQWLTDQKAGSVLCVLRAAAVICRTVPLPDAPVEQLEPALRLQAEAHLLGTAPPHRVAMAVLPASIGETTRSGIVLAWPESAEFIAPVVSHPVRYIADIAAIAALLNGQRPAEPLMWLDRGDGSVGIALTHSGGAIFRATHEEADSAEAWQKSVGRIVAETGLGVGHTGGFVEGIVETARARAASVGTKDAALFLPDEIRAAATARISGADDDAKWWNDYGIAAGAAIAATGALAPLATMQHTPPVQRPSRIRSALEAMSRPRAAATIVAAAVLLLMFAPLIFSGLRLVGLKVRYGDVQNELSIARTSRDQVAVYRELERQDVWPMTKLLSDIATNAPLGIELEIMRVDAGKEFSVSGTAISKDGKTPPELVSQMVANLRADGIFVEPAVQWGDANNLGVYKFDITGKVSRPYLSANYPPERDFGLWTHENRRDGVPMPKPGSPRPAAGNPPTGAVASAGNSTTLPTGVTEDAGGGDPADNSDDAGADATTANAAAADASAIAAMAANGETGEPPVSDSGARRPGNLTSGGAGDNPADAASGAASAGSIPEPISEEQIKAMSEAELRAELGKRSKARQYAPEGPDKDRLKKEFEQVLAELKRKREQGGGQS